MQAPTSPTPKCRTLRSSALLASYNEQELQISVHACITCGPGRFTYPYDTGITGEGQTAARSVCPLCYVGNYCSVDPGGTTSTKSPCPSGRYNDQEGLIGECPACPSGTYTPYTGSSALSACYQYICDGGLYTMEDATPCVTCPQGYYCSVDPGNVGPTKKACPVGRFIQGNGSRGQEYYINSAYVPCNACSAGTYTEREACTGCLTCPKGYYCSINYESYIYGTTKNACPAGSYSDTEGFNGCTSPNGCTSNFGCFSCPTGTYSTTEASPSSANCLVCAEGKTSDSTGNGATGCVSCPLGKFSMALWAMDHVSARVCTTCEKGFYADEEGLSQCKSCAAGKVTENAMSTATTDCVSCPKGKYGVLTVRAETNNQVPARVCASCEIGFYADEEGLSQCKSCPGGRSTRDIFWRWVPSGSTGNGIYERVSYPLAESESSCVACPAGTYGASSTSLLSYPQLPAGYVGGGDVTRVSCAPCNPGTESLEASASVSGCSICPANSYSALIVVPEACLSKLSSAIIVTQIPAECPASWCPSSKTISHNGYTQTSFTCVWPKSEIFPVASDYENAITPMLNENDPLTVLSDKGGTPDVCPTDPDAVAPGDRVYCSDVSTSESNCKVSRPATTVAPSSLLRTFPPFLDAQFF